MILSITVWLAPMIDSVNDDVDIQIPVSEYPDDALIYFISFYCKNE